LKYRYKISPPPESELEINKEELLPNEVVELFSQYPWVKEFAQKLELQNESPIMEFTECSNEEQTISMGLFENKTEPKFSVLYKDQETKLIESSKVKYVLQLFVNNKIHKLETLIGELKEQPKVSKNGDHPFWFKLLMNLIVISIFAALAFIAYSPNEKGLSVFFGSISCIYILTLFYFSLKQVRSRNKDYH